MGISKKGFFILAILLIFADVAFCQAGGLDNVKGLLDKVKFALTSISVVTVTIAILWVGYKVLFGGSTIRECMPIIIGAILIAGAAQIADLLVG
ncbi:MAG: TrbC/VirB2 family protein [Campylobacteraceae bacterium]|jgi:type IV secretion system protein VirB2|nr:TrbC/VirB2 family protein [Campylobacteraceae bacterium]